MDYALSCTLLENFQVQVSSRAHAWIVDEPAELDGDDLGPNPFELLLGALGSCMAITLADYGALGRVPIEKLWVDVTGHWDDQKEFHVHITVRVRGDLSDEHLERVRADVERCQAHRLLSRGIDIQTEVVRV